MPGAISNTNGQSQRHFSAVREQLKACLGSTTPTSTFMHQGTLETYPNPGIKIKGVDKIGLPLSPRDIDTVKQASHRAPSGKGTKTIVDESVRKTWQIDAADLACSNPKWDSWVKDDLLPKCCDALGVPALTKPYVHAELYKMLLYEEGAHFKPHKDTEKAPGISRTSAFDLSFSAWYADVMHEVKPITPGHRVVLTYNVINDARFLPLPAAATHGDHDSQLQQVLRQWSDEDIWYSDINDEVDFLCHCLEHEYSWDSLSLPRLVGNDLQVVSRTAQAAKRTKLVVYLATFERKRVGDCQEDESEYGDHEDSIPEFREDYEIEDEWFLRRVVALDGKDVAEDVAIGSHYMLDPKILESLKPDDEEFSGWTGNEGASLTLWYRRSVMLLMPKKNLASFQVQRIKDVTATVKEYVKERLDPLKADPENKEKQDDLYDFCVEVMVTIEREKEEEQRRQDAAKSDGRPYSKYGNRSYEHFKEEDKGLLIVCFAWLGMPEMCERVGKLMDLPLDKCVCADLRTPIERTGGIARYQSFLTEALFYEDLEDLYYALHALVGAKGKSGCDPAALPWAREMFLRTMDSYPPPPQSTMKDAEAIILMWICEWCGPSIYAESVFPFVLRQVSQAWFSVSFASYLLAPVHHKALDGIDPLRIRKDGFRIIKALVDEPYVQTADMMDYDGEMRPMNYIGSGYVAQVYSYMDTYSRCADSPPDRDAFLRKMVYSSLPTAKKSPSLFRYQLLPLARHLADVLVLSDPETHTESHRNVCSLVTEIWTAYLRDIVQARPPTPNLALAPLRDYCKCDDCKQVNQFLQDPTQYSYVFRAGKERRNHIESELWLMHGQAPPYETLKEGNPHALIISKELDFVHEMELHEWNDKAKEAQEALEECPNLVVGKMFDASLLTVLPEDSMRIILGDSFSVLVLLKAPEYAMQALPPTGSTLTPVSGDASTTTSAKRKASDDGADMTEPKRSK